MHRLNIQAICLTAYLLNRSYCLLEAGYVIDCKTWPIGYLAPGSAFSLIRNS